MSLTFVELYLYSTYVLWLTYKCMLSKLHSIHFNISLTTRITDSVCKQCLQEPCMLWLLVFCSPQNYNSITVELEADKKSATGPSITACNSIIWQIISTVACVVPPLANRGRLTALATRRRPTAMPYSEWLNGDQLAQTPPYVAALVLLLLHSNIWKSQLQVGS